MIVLKDEVKKAIDEIRPQIQVHGGDVELINVEDGVVKVRLTGACVGCPMSQMTLQYGVGRRRVLYEAGQGLYW